MAFPIDPFEQLHYNMVRGLPSSRAVIHTRNSHRSLAHHTFKLGYSIIIQNLEESKDAIEKDLPNFLGYCQAWATSINVHHDSEVRHSVTFEKYLFTACV